MQYELEKLKNMPGFPVMNTINSFLSNVSFKGLLPQVKIFDGTPQISAIWTLIVNQEIRNRMNWGILKNVT